MPTNIADQKTLAVLDFIAIGHIMSGTVAFTLTYYPFILLGVSSTVMVGWAFFMVLIANRVYTEIETKLLQSLELKIKRDGPPAVVFLTIITLIGALLGLAMSSFWINIIVIGVEATGFMLLFMIIRQSQSIPTRRKVNVKKLMHNLNA